LNKPDEVSEGARETRPDESEKSALTLPNSSETGGGRIRAFEQIMLGRSALVAVKFFIQS
jgi:hypothetical protein